MILAHSDFLQQPQISQIDLSSLQLNQTQIKGSPCLIKGDPKQFSKPSDQNQYLLYLPLEIQGHFCRIFTDQQKAVVDFELNFDQKNILGLAFSSGSKYQDMTVIIQKKNSSLLTLLSMNYDTLKSWFLSSEDLFSKGIIQIEHPMFLDKPDVVGGGGSSPVGCYTVYQAQDAESIAIVSLNQARQRDKDDQRNKDDDEEKVHYVCLIKMNDESNISSEGQSLPVNNESEISSEGQSLPVHTVISLKQEPIFQNNTHVHQDIAFLAHNIQGEARLVRWSENQRESEKNQTISLKDLNSTHVCSTTIDQGIEDFAQIGSQPQVCTISLETIGSSSEIEHMQYRSYQYGACNVDTRVQREVYQYIRPYIVRVRNNSEMYIMSEREDGQPSGSRFKAVLSLPNNFMCFAQIYNSQLVIKEQECSHTFNQGNTLAFFTLETYKEKIQSSVSTDNQLELEKCVLKLNLVTLPSDGQPSPANLELTAFLPSQSLNYCKMNRERILRAFIGTFKHKGRDPIFAVIQYPNEVLIAEFNTNQYRDKRFFTNKSLVPMIPLRPNRNVEVRDLVQVEPVSFIVHCAESTARNRKSSCLYKLSIGASITFEPLLPVETFQDVEILSMSLITSTGAVVLLDDQMKVYIIKQSEEIETGGQTWSHKILGALHPQALPHIRQLSDGLLLEIALTDKDAYLGPKFFLHQPYLSPSKAQTQFEEIRDKRIPGIDTSKYLMGPLESLDKNALMYVSTKLQGLKKRYNEITISPYLSRKEISFRHSDLENDSSLRFSAFTPKEDTLLLCGSGTILIFTQQGNLQRVDITPQELFQSPNYIERVMYHDNNTMSFLLYEQESDTWTLAKLECQPDYKISKVSQGKGKKVKQTSSGMIYQLQVNEDPQSIESITLDVKNFIIDEQKEAQKIQKRAQLVITKELLPILNEQLQKFKPQDRKRINDSLITQRVDTDSKVDFRPNDTATIPLKEKEKPAVPPLDLDFEVVRGEYLVVRVLTRIYYVHLLAREMSVQEVQVGLRVPGKVTEMGQTEGPGVVQFVYMEGEKRTYIISWDLVTNQEHSILELPAELDVSPPFLVKGLSERLNYLVAASSTHQYYDHRFNFPLSFFSGGSSSTSWERGISDYSLEAKFSKEANSHLGLSGPGLGTLFLPYSYLETQYRTFCASRPSSIEDVIPAYMNSKFPSDGKTFMHLAAKSEKFLQLVARSKNQQEFALYLVYPDHAGETPISLGVDQNNSKSINLMLDMIAKCDTQYNFSRHLLMHIHSLFELKSESFLKYLATCTYKIRKPLVGTWPADDITVENVYFGHNSCYFGDQTLREVFQILSVNEVKTAVQKDRLTGDREITVNYFSVKPDQSGEKERKTQKITLEVLEFDWIFQNGGQMGKSFIRYLCEQNEVGSQLFANPVIRHLIMYQWQGFRLPFIKKKLIWEVLYFLMIIFFVTLTHEYAKLDHELLRHLEKAGGWDLAHFILGCLILSLSVYFLFLEFMRYLDAGISKHLAFESVFILLTISLVILNFLNLNDTHFRIISVFVLAMNYLNMILYLRFIDRTAVIVSMLKAIISDMQVFTGIFMVGVVAFANMFFLMQDVAQNEDRAQSPDETQVVGGNFALACLYAFDAVFGNFDTGNFHKYREHQWVLWLIYVCLIFVQTLVMMNMIIALMGGTYAKFDAVQREERLQAKCLLIHENEWIFDRKKRFAGVKYVVVATKASSATADAQLQRQAELPQQSRDDRDADAANERQLREIQATLSQLQRQVALLQEIKLKEKHQSYE